MYMCFTLFGCGKLCILQTVQFIVGQAFFHAIFHTINGYATNGFFALVERRVSVLIKQFFQKINYLLNLTTLCCAVGEMLCGLGFVM